MKKVFLAVISAAVIALCMCSCGNSNAGSGSGTASTAAKEINLSEVISTINSSSPNQMELIEGVDDLNKYYSISKEDVKSFGAEIDKSGIDEVVIVEAVDADAAARIQAKLQQRYNSKKQLGASYSPEDLQIIKNCSVKTNGNIVSMIISSNAGAMEEVLNSAVNG